MFQKINYISYQINEDDICGKYFIIIETTEATASCTTPI